MVSNSGHSAPFRLRLPVPSGFGGLGNEQSRAASASSLALPLHRFAAWQNNADLSSLEIPFGNCRIAGVIQAVYCSLDII